MSEQLDGARVLHIRDVDALAAPLLECSQSGEFLCLVLPDGARLWVHPEEHLRGLVKLLADPDFLGQLGGAAEDFVCGRGLVLEKGQTPQRVLEQAVATDEFAELLSDAAEDVRARRGRTFDAKCRPT